MSYQNEDQENFEMGTVCNTLKYHVNLFGYKVNIFVLALVVAVIVGLVLYRQSQNESAPVMTTDTLSATSLSGGLASIYRQMGGGYSMSTPDFIKRLN